MFRLGAPRASLVGIVALLTCLDVGLGQNALRPSSGPTTQPSAWRAIAPASDADVYAALERPIGEITYERAALADVIRDLRQRLGVNIHVQVERLAACGVEMSRPVSLTLKHVTAKRVLRLVLADVSPEDALSYDVLDGVLVISDRGTLERQLVLRTYDVRDLLTRYPMSDDTDPREEVQNRIYRLAKVVTDCIDPDSWAVNGGGEGGIHPFRGILTITNTLRVHEQVSGLLDALRSTPTGGRTAVPAVAENQRRLDEPVRAALDTVLATVDYDGVSLARVVDDLHKRFDINVHVLSQELRDVGIGGEKAVRLQLHNVTARRMLTQVLSDLREKARLGFEIDAGVLVIGLEDEVSRRYNVVVYNVGDLADTEGRRAVLVKLLTDQIDYDSWSVNGGGQGTAYCLGPWLVVSQTAPAQAQIGAFLRELRQRLAGERATSQP